MKIYYDKTVDALYLKISEEKPEGVTEIKEEYNLDLTESGKLVGIEILNASKKVDLSSFLTFSIEAEPSVLSEGLG